MPRAAGLFTRYEMQNKVSKAALAGSSLPLPVLHKRECRACPLDKVRYANNPKMEPTGVDNPLVYVLGEAPGAVEDEVGEQFVGNSGKLLRAAMPRGYRKHTRWNSVVRTRTPKSRAPTEVEIECCRPSVQRDIEAAQPRVIVGCGGVPLKWATGLDGISAWRGRPIPVTVGSHVCWYMPVLHPAYILRLKNSDQTGRRQVPGDEHERTLRRDLHAAFALADGGEPASVYAPEKALDGVVVETDPKKIVRRLEKLQGARLGTLDYETKGSVYDAASRRLLTASLGRVAGDCPSVAFPIEHSQSKLTAKERRLVLDAMLDTLGTFGAIVCHNATFEMLWTVGVSEDESWLWDSVWHCTQNQAYVLDERLGSGVQSLDGITMRNLGLRVKEVTKLDSANADAQPLSKVLPYNGMDTKFTGLNYLVQREALKREGLWKTYLFHVERLSACTAATWRGMPVDAEEVERQIEASEKAQREAVDKLREHSSVRRYEKRGGSLVLSNDNAMVKLINATALRGSRKQIKSITAADGVDHEIARHIRRGRRAHKLVSTYLLPLTRQHEKSVVHGDGCIHPTFNATFTGTGRLSSSGPNAQNYPKRKDKQVRDCVKARDGWVFISADYGQIEARLIGVEAEDPVLCDSLLNRWDIHLHWAERLSSIYPKALDARGGDLKTLRSDMKNQLVFPSFYGARMESTANYMHIPLDYARELFDEFWKDHGAVAEWQTRLLTQSRQAGYVETKTGRRRHGPLNKNMVMNSPIQGGAADIVVDAMTRLGRFSHDEKLPHLSPRLNIHDDLTFMVPKSELDACIETVSAMMLDTPFDWLTVPMSVEVEVGERWGSMEEVGTFDNVDEFIVE